MSDEGYHDKALEMEVYPHLRVALDMVDTSLPRIAVDAGCGVGRDALFLVEQGYEVHAYDKSDVAIARLREMAGKVCGEVLFPEVSSFEAFEYPKSSLISACSSLFFCDPGAFPFAWERIARSLVRGGIFCGHFMGPNDSWARMERGDLTIFDRAGLGRLFDRDFRIIDIHEHDAEGATLLGATKHWHTYSVVARKST